VVRVRLQRAPKVCARSDASVRVKGSWPPWSPALGSPARRWLVGPDFGRFAGGPAAGTESVPTHKHTRCGGKETAQKSDAGGHQKKST
jgi:hypothetical protein